MNGDLGHVHKSLRGFQSERAEELSELTDIFKSLVCHSLYLTEGTHEV